VLIRGIVFEKMSISPLTGKSASGCTIASMICAFQVTALSGAPLTLRDSEPQPDLTLVSGAESDFDLRHPSTAELVVEGRRLQ
jgi:hypothetical protein